MENHKDKESNIPFLDEEINPFQEVTSSISSLNINEANKSKTNDTTSSSLSSGLKSSSRITIKSGGANFDPLTAALEKPKSYNKPKNISIKDDGNLPSPTIEKNISTPKFSFQTSNETIKSPNKISQNAGLKESSDNISDDDLPLIKNMKSPIKSTFSSNKLNEEEPLKSPSDKPIPIFNVSVSNPRKVNDAVNPYTVYRVSTWTNSTAYKKREFDVNRRFRDFLWLYQQLVANNPGVIVPPPPEKHAIGRFQDEFVESRRKALEIMISKITSHPRLYGDPDVTFFLESTNFTNEVSQRKKESTKGFFRALGEAVSSATSAFTKYSEPDDWFESRRHQLDQLEIQLKALHKSIELAAKQRKELGSNHLDFGEAMVSLASAEVNKNLSKHFLDLGNLQKRLKELQEAQSKEDTGTLSATAEQYLRIIGSIRSAFDARSKSYSNWKSLLNEFDKKNSALAKSNPDKIRPDKLTQLHNEVNQLERKVLNAKNEFEDISKLVKEELDRFDAEKVEDFQKGVQEFLEKMIKSQKEIVKLWKDFIESLKEPIASEPSKGSVDQSLSKTDDQALVEPEKTPENIESPEANGTTLDTSGLRFSNPTSPNPLSPPNHDDSEQNLVPLSPPSDPTTSIWG